MIKYIVNYSLGFLINVSYLFYLYSIVHDSVQLQFGLLFHSVVMLAGAIIVLVARCRADGFWHAVTAWGMLIYVYWVTLIPDAMTSHRRDVGYWIFFFVGGAFVTFLLILNLVHYVSDQRKRRV